VRAYDHPGTSLLTDNLPGLSPRVEQLRSGALDSEGEFHQWYSLWAESLAATEGEPLTIRRGKAFAHLLEQMDLVLPSGALIVGRHPKTVLDEAEADRTRSAWHDLANPPDASELHYQEEGLFRASVILLHIAPNTREILEHGLGGLCRKIRSSLETAEDGGDFLRGALICAEAAQRFIGRYAELAEREAAEESHPQREAELREIAENCRRIASDPPDSFWAGLQLVWFIYLLVNLEAGASIGQSGPGCLDRWLIDHYHRDVEEGRLTPARALELLECLFVEMNASLPRDGILPLAIGGLGADGEGAENELTSLCLRAVAELRLLHPSLALRVHRRMPPELLRAALLSIGSGNSYPALFNDEVCVPSLRRSGVSEEDSLEWVHSICTELTAVGKTYAWIAAPYLNLAKCLELALNHGRCMLTDRQLGPDLGDLTTYSDFEELYAAYLDQVSHVMGEGVAAAGRNKQQAKERTPYPFLACLTADCIERGRDYTDGGARYQPDYVQGIGLSTVADSLAAMRRFMFDGGEIPPEKLLAAMKSDFVGSEALRQRLLNRAPKFGNDDDYADEIYVRLVEDLYREVNGRTDGVGGVCFPGFMTWESHNLLGKGTGASADGRRARAALSDSVGAVQGMDRLGLTALLRSVTKADFVPSVGGVTFNVKAAPDLFQNEGMLGRLEAALRAYFDAGGFQVQVNVLSRDVLAAARDQPELHRNLIVRVGGFSAYFVELDRGIQQEIIARTMHQ
jgi:formate C-acetyltransferase